jgi:hypothetical protein
LAGLVSSRILFDDKTKQSVYKEAVAVDPLICLLGLTQSKQNTINIKSQI